GGAVVGATPGPTDLFLSPFFCDLHSGHVNLSPASLLLAAGDCGLIGALGQGCGTTTAVEPAAAAPPETFRVWPVPSRGTVGFSIPPSTSAADIEVFDVTGARRWHSSLAAGAS